MIVTTKTVCERGETAEGGRENRRWKKDEEFMGRGGSAL